MSPVTMEKRYKTRDGREVIIHSVTGPNEREPVIASINQGGVWDVSTWYPNGKSVLGPHLNDGDLIEVREPREWVLAIAIEGNAYHAPGEVVCVSPCHHTTTCNWIPVKVREVMEGES